MEEPGQVAKGGSESGWALWITDVVPIVKIGLFDEPKQV